jgi:hypothetical protein
MVAPYPGSIRFCFCPALIFVHAGRMEPCGDCSCSNYFDFRRRELLFPAGGGGIFFPRQGAGPPPKPPLDISLFKSETNMLGKKHNVRRCKTLKLDWSN